MAVYGLSVDWYDPQPMLTRQFVMRIYAEERQVEMYDAKSRRTFLKKSPLPASIMIGDLYLGNEIVLHSRALKIVQYADHATAMALSGSQLKSTVVLTPSCLLAGKLGKIISMLENAGLMIKKLKMVAFGESEAYECTSLLSRDPQVAHLLGSSNCVVVVVSGTDAVRVLISTCKEISDLLGDGMEEIAISAPNNKAAADLEELTFGTTRPLAHWPTARFGTDCTCCVIRPHVISAKKFGAILSHIEATKIYEISALALFKLDIPAATEFLEIYEGVIPAFEASVKQLSSGPCCALELRANGSTVQQFRDTCGPWDVNFAKEIRPNTIRAKFGVDGIENAVHCTDLPDDGGSEVRYFFEILEPI